MVVCIEFDKKLIGETETVTINVSIYSQISIAEKLFFQLREATLQKIFHCSFIVTFIFEKITAFLLLFDFVTAYLKFELLGYFFARALIDSN